MLFKGSTDACEIVNDGKCITDGDSNYGNGESCVYGLMKDLTISSTDVQYEVELHFDYISIGNTE